MAKKLRASLKPGINLFHAIKSNITQNSTLSTITGNESFDDFKTAIGNMSGTEGLALTQRLSTIKATSMDAFLGAASRGEMPGELRDTFQKYGNAYAEVEGFEGFSMQNFKGKQQEIKAANMTLNAQSHLQTPAAEALFTTISLRYEDEGAELMVRAAGLGTYAYGNSAWQAASELRPIFGLLRTGEMFRDEVLSLYPVYPEDADDDTRSLFLDKSVIAPTPVSYMPGDAYGRQAHKTQFLAVPCTIPNLLALSQAPGQRPWTSTDEIESNSISIAKLALSASIGGTAGAFFIDTVSMSNNTFGPSNMIQTSDDRGLNLRIRNLPGFSVLDKDGLAVGETLFAAYKTAGYEPLLNVSVSGNYQRQTNELQLNAGTVEVHQLRNISTGTLVNLGGADDQQRALIKQLTKGSVIGVRATFNVTNISRGNFGYRIEVFDAIKHLSVQRRSPVSVKYPISKEDVNQESLDYAIEQMAIVINNQCSKHAFDKAHEHLRYITGIDGAPVVGNQQGSNVLAGQHYVTASAVNRSIRLADAVSAESSSDVFDSVCAVLTNELSDITAALNTKSGLAAIAEYGGTNGKVEWTAVVHQNLERFIMRSGDARSIGNQQTLTVVETNFDSQIGEILIVPKNTSTNDNINPLGGVGVCVSKENILVQGNVTRDNQDFGVVMTLPIYKHWPLCPIIGSLKIEDAHEFLGDEGILWKLAHQRVLVDNIGDAGKNVSTGGDNGGTSPQP